MTHKIENLTKILAIDQATLSGVCRVFIDAAGAHYETFTIEPPSDQATGAARLFFYEQWIAGELRQGVQMVVLEDVPAHVRRNTTAQVGIVTLIELAAFKRQIPLITLNGSTLKKWATGNGNALKPAIIEAALREHGIECQTADEADALFLGHFGYMLGTGQHDLNEYRQSVLDHYRNPGIRHAQKQAAAKRKRTRVAAKKAQQLLPIQEAA